MASSNEMTERALEVRRQREEQTRELSGEREEVQRMLASHGWKVLLRQLEHDAAQLEQVAATAVNEFQYMRASLAVAQVRHFKTVGERMLNRLGNELDLLQDKYK